MNRQKTILFALALVLMGATGAILTNLRAHQKLGLPAVKTSAQLDSPRLLVDLPERVLDCESEFLPPAKMEMEYLPQDTSFGHRRYTAQDKFRTDVNVVLMGTDRTSLHKPQFCLSGQGWSIDDNASTETSVRIERPYAYDLPVMRLISTKGATVNGQQVVNRGVYVYWFVAQDEYTAKHWQRMWWMARDLFRTGVLQRWAYVSYFSVCRPGEESATFERMKKLIAASVPEFQLTPAPVGPTASLRP